MTSRQSILGLAVLISITSLACPAADARDDDESNWYVGFNLGQSSIDDDVDGLGLDDSATAFRLYGGFDFNRFFGVEVQYVDFGEVSGEANVNGTTLSATASATGFGFAGVARIALGDGINLTGRAGYLSWDVDVEAVGIGDGSSDQDIYFGLGAEWLANDQWALVGDLERYKLDDVDVNLWSLGARFRF